MQVILQEIIFTFKKRPPQSHYLALCVQKASCILLQKYCTYTESQLCLHLIFSPRFYRHYHLCFTMHTHGPYKSTIQLIQMGDYSHVSTLAPKSMQQCTCRYTMFIFSYFSKVYKMSRAQTILYMFYALVLFLI